MLSDKFMCREVADTSYHGNILDCMYMIYRT